MTSVGRRRWSQYLILVGAGLFVAAVWWAGWREIAGALADCRLAYVAAAVGLQAVALWVRVAKWRYALGPAGHAMRVFFISKAAGNYTPGRVGELSPLLLAQHRTPKMGAWIVAARVTEAGAGLALGLAGVLALGLDVAPGVMPTAWMIFGAAAVGALVLGLTLLAYQRLAPRLESRPRLKRVAAMLGALAFELRQLRGKAVPVILMTLTLRCLDIIIAILLYKSFGYAVPFLLMAVAKSAHGLVSALPVTPEVSGAPFVAAAFLLHEGAGIPVDVLTAAIAIEIVISHAVFWSCFAGAALLRKNTPA